MLKKIISLVLIFSVFSMQAMAAAPQGLKSAFDELNYSLSVEWDQKDPAFKLNQVEKFNSALYALKAQGLSNAELIQFLKTEIKDQGLARDLEAAFNMISLQKMGPAEANNYILEIVKDSYAVGASWSPKQKETLFYIGIGVLVVTLAIIIANSARKTSFCEDFKDKNTLVCDYYSHGGIPYDDCYYTDSHCK